MTIHVEKQASKPPQGKGELYVEPYARAAASAGSPQSKPRRAFLRWVSRGALGSLVAAATVFRSSSPAHAHGYHYACCHLAKSNSGSACASDCNLFSSYNIRSWTCCHTNGYLYVCRECTQSSSCWYGPFLCSYYYRTSTRC